jgi:hypothetical protein
MQYIINISRDLVARSVAMRRGSYTCRYGSENRAGERGDVREVPIALMLPVLYPWRR